MKYLFLDSEMGGLGLDKSLLTLYLEFTDDKLETVEPLHLFLKPDDGVYRVEGGGLRVNGIDLTRHDLTAIPYKKGGTLLYEFLKKHQERPEDIVPVGHGVDGDIRHITDKLVARGTWEQFCSHRYLDTSSVCKFLQLKGLLPASLKGSLESLKEHYGIQETSHTADGDVRTIKQVLKHFLNLS